MDLVIHVQPLGPPNPRNRRSAGDQLRTNTLPAKIGMDSCVGNEGMCTAITGHIDKADQVHSGNCPEMSEALM